MTTYRTIDEILAGRRNVSEAGRQTLGSAVSIDHDWALPASSVDMLIAALGNLSDDDMDGAYLLACHLQEAIACIQIRRDMEADAAQQEESTQ